MGAPKGNQFWKIRAKHGRDKLFKTPELLWEAATEYFEWCDANPLIEIDFKGKDASKVELPRMRAYTMHGLCIYLDCSTEFFKNFEQNNKDAKDFMPIISRIKEVIYNQKFSGAAAGFLNPNIIARDLGLKDSTDVTTKGESMNKITGIEIIRTKK